MCALLARLSSNKPLKDSVIIWEDQSIIFNDVITYLVDCYKNVSLSVGNLASIVMTLPLQTSNCIVYIMKGL